MDNRERWEEICYLLSKSVPATASEQLFEQKVIQAFDKLGWREYKGEISIRETIRVGSANRVEPDIILKSEDGVRQIVVEVKKPSVDINYGGFKDQLSSYMRLLRLNFGVLIGNKIQIYMDGSEIGTDGLVLIEEFEYNEHDQVGEDFIELFLKEGFNIKKFSDYSEDKLKKIASEQTKIFLESQFASRDFEGEIKQLIIDSYSTEYEIPLLESILDKFDITISKKDSSYNISGNSIKRVITQSSAVVKREITNNTNKLSRVEINRIVNNYLSGKGIRIPKIKATSNITSQNEWFIEPNINNLMQDFSIVFVNSNKSILYVFIFKANELDPLENNFYIREDSNSISIKVAVADINYFKNIRSKSPKNINLVKYLKHSIQY